ncbi:MAG: L-seryl-tRNA(Sec) selenium transferase, partial [Ardenticatenia bacterium]
MPTHEHLRRIPSVNRLLQTPALQEAMQAFGRAPVVAAVRETLDAVRDEIAAGRIPDLTPEALTPRIIAHLHRRVFPTLRPIINATGVIIHTNLGRAPISQAALEAIRTVGAGYSNLEYDLESGRRGSRYTHVGALLAELTGAEAGLVANNNAAALVLILATHAAGRDVLISRAHLVEIGGGFRIPDIMAQSGAHLREVGTTNRTYIRDYEAAITPEQCAMILRVHTSNFRIEGFVHQPTLKELVALARRYGLLVGDDLGSGALLDTTQFGLAPEPRPQESIADGADVVCFSGDKLLGGPQAGC